MYAIYNQYASITIIRNDNIWSSVVSNQCKEIAIQRFDKSESLYNSKIVLDKKTKLIIKRTEFQSQAIN